MKKMNRQLLISLLLCLVPFGMGLAFYERLPEQIAIHFGVNNMPNSFASKPFALFAIPAFLLVIHLIVWFQLENDPKRQNYAKSLRGLSCWLVPVISVVMQTGIITYAMGVPFSMGFYISLGLGVLLMVLGNYLPKCRQNYTMGIRLPWTLHSEENWNRTHRLAGWTWLGGGALLVVNAFLNLPWVGLAIVLFIVLIPAVYSYLLSRKLGKDGGDKAAG
ncbi:SdpI family protein [Zongyangia hominis]|uniref:SdpI family protein n=1 Tax=Zongyangia hominis TaxID=2763677 RepID=A0A926ECU4_9FIRM|nr:SdpI family protein [Zongyangia hominis]MBC8569412.1 SdpI family protein [Zongyangia hominis]